MFFNVTVGTVSITSPLSLVERLSDDSDSPNVLILSCVPLIILKGILVLLVLGFPHFRKHRGTEKLFSVICILNADNTQCIYIKCSHQHMASGDTLTFRTSHAHSFPYQFLKLTVQYVAYNVCCPRVQETVPRLVLFYIVFEIENLKLICLFVCLFSVSLLMGTFLLHYPSVCSKTQTGESGSGEDNHN